MYQYNYWKTRSRMAAAGLNWEDVPADYRDDLRKANHHYGAEVEYFGSRAMVRLDCGTHVPLVDCVEVESEVL